MGDEAGIFDGTSAAEAVLNADDISRWVGEVQRIGRPVIEGKLHVPGHCFNFKCRPLCEIGPETGEIGFLTGNLLTLRIELKITDTGRGGEGKYKNIIPALYKDFHLLTSFGTAAAIGSQGCLESEIIIGQRPHIFYIADPDPWSLGIERQMIFGEECTVDDHFPSFRIYSSFLK